MRRVAVCSLVLWIGLTIAGRGEDSPPAEAERLPHAAGQDQQIRVDLKICELSLTKLRQLGIAFVQLEPAAADGSKTSGGAAEKTLPTFASVDSDGFAGVVEMLRREKVLTVTELTPPTQIMSDGRTAYFLSAGGVPWPLTRADWSKRSSSASRKIGNQVDLTASLLEGGRIRLNVRAKVTEVDPSMTITLNGRKVLGYNTREMDLPVEMELGKTAVIGGLIQENMEVVVAPKPRQRSNVRDTTQMLVVIRPEVIDAPAE
jgi:Flp pilus assembly secretin CpaC